MSKLFRFLGLITHLKTDAREWRMFRLLLYRIIVRSNESHSAYFVEKWGFVNVTNLSHAIAYAGVPFSVFLPE